MNNTTIKPLKKTKMTGNIWITVKTFFHQHLFCMHKYKWVYRRDNGADFQVCEKCDLIK